jgi:hypothetical protein
MAKTERLEFRTDSTCINLLEELAKKDGVTRSEIVRRAIGLYAWASEEAGNGRYLTAMPAPSASKKPKPNRGIAKTEQPAGELIPAV